MVGMTRSESGKSQSEGLEAKTLPCTRNRWSRKGFRERLALKPVATIISSRFWGSLLPFSTGSALDEILISFGKPMWL